MWKKKYEWRVTWPGEGHEDWIALNDGLEIGRVMRDLTTSGKKNWFMWTGNSTYLRTAGPKVYLRPAQGWCQEHWQAAKAVEDWYDRLLEINNSPAR